MNKFREEYASVNGIEHFLLHYPKAPDAPVLLYLHGGPGSFESLFAYALDAAWGDMFTQVHWDQRGAGKTLRRNKSGLPESVNQMLDDLHGIIAHLLCTYQVQRIVLLGHSWGSLLGSLYVLQHPENVLAYIGVGQVVSMVENERIAYRETMQMARKAGDQKQLRALEKLGTYPPSDAGLLMKLLPKFRKIQQVYDDGPCMGEMIKSMRRSPSFRWSDFISFMRAMKVNHPLVLQVLSFNLNDFSPHYEVPVHYILGDTDTVTPTSLAKEYHQTIAAPYKTIAVIAGAGHNPMHDRPDEFARALRAVRETL